MLTEAERQAAPTAPVREMVRFALPQAGASIFGIQTLGLGIILTGIFSSNAQVGIFGVALMLQGPGNIFLGSIVNIWAPMVSDLHEKGQIKRLGSLYQTINRWIATFSFPVYAALIIIPDWFVHLFAGSHASGAAPVVAVLAVGNILYVLLGWWIVPEHGALGMAIVDSSVTAVINSVRVLEAWILVGVQPFGRSYIKPVLATVAGSLVLLAGRFIVGDSMIAETAALAASVVVFLVVLAALGMDQEERYVWDRIRKRAFKRGNKTVTP
jgi:O-antigen/teichoic acid export membrane protein